MRYQTTVGVFAIQPHSILRNTTYYTIDVETMEINIDIGKLVFVLALAYTAIFFLVINMFMYLTNVHIS